MILLTSDYPDMDPIGVRVSLVFNENNRDDDTQLSVVSKYSNQFRAKCFLTYFKLVATQINSL